MLRIRSDGKLASPTASVRASVGLMNGQLDSAASGRPQESMASNVILKAHPDGKLSSPRAGAATEAAKPKSRSKISRSDVQASPSCIVVIKYGADGDSRGLIGQRLNEILQGNRKIPDSRSSKPSEPAKTTHPFFAGKFRQQAGQRPEQPSTSERHTSQAVKAREICGPRESRVTSKPPGTEETTNLASGPIYPTFGTDYGKIARFPGAQDPIWPPCDMLHVGRVSNSTLIPGSLAVTSNIPREGRKLKNAQIKISSVEDVLSRLTNVVHRLENSDAIREMTSRDTRNYRRPHRKIMTGHALQQAISTRVASNLPSVLSSGTQQRDESRFPIHKALLHVYKGISQSRSAFDLFGYETQEWVHKYSPAVAEHVLQQGREAIVLKDWLKRSIVTSLGRGAGQTRARASSALRGKSSARGDRKIKRRAKELDGFVVSSDEDTGDMDEISDPEISPPVNLHYKKSVMCTDASRNGERNANAVVISGPHGCGKTAAVFAVARELGFEIFEVNAGSRRSGKDILDRVGDMTRNHLVKHRQDENVMWSNAQSKDPKNAGEDSRSQGQMKSHFQMMPDSTAEQPNEGGKPDVKSRGLKSKKSSPKKNVLKENVSQPPEQKQSLILLEEVDVLFEEDKLFWATVVDLVVRSKRPVIMTCSDESLLPLDGLALYAILRFAPPPEQLATDYLLLVAASEGHLLTREAIQCLYAAKRFDLRASLAELSFYCQMGVGDSKGGLEWMLINEHAGELGPESQSLRVISEDTYCTGMGWLSGEDLSRQACSTLDEVTDLCTEVWNGWGLDIAATDIFMPSENYQALAPSREEAWHSLQHFDHSCEAFSAADTLPASIVRHEGFAGLDLQQPDLTDKSRCNYVEGRTLLQADPFVDYTDMSGSVAMSLRASATVAGKESNSSIVNVPKVIGLIPRMLCHQGSLSQSLKLQIWSAFQPIAEYAHSMPGDSRCPSLSALNRPVSLVATEIAPYIRAIVSYDLRLEEQRRQLSSLLGQTGVGNSKLRTTRASRAALEGGSKADIRRERWFPDSIDFDAILGTGVTEWQNIALQALSAQPWKHDGNECESRGLPLARDFSCGI